MGKNNDNKEQKMKEVIDLIEGLKGTHPLNPQPIDPTLPIGRPSAPRRTTNNNYSLFFSDVKSDAEVIFKEGTIPSTVDGKFGIITGNLFPNCANTDHFFQYQLLGSDNAFTFEASILTSQTPLSVSCQNPSNMLIAFISGIGELATTTRTFDHIPFTLIIQKTPQLCGFLLTINPLVIDAPIIIAEDNFASCDRIIIQKC